MKRERAAIRTCTRAILRAADEATITNEVCRVLREDAGYGMAWIGYLASDATASMHVVARTGPDDEWPTTAEISSVAPELGQHPAGHAIRRDQTVCIDDIATDPRTERWRETGLQHGRRSSISLPLKDRGSDTFGVLEIYSARPGAFTPDHARILEELAEDLAFCILSLRIRSGRQVAAAAMRRNELALKQAQRVGRLGSWDWDATTDTITWSEEYYRIYGFDPTQAPPGYVDHLKAYTPESAARLDAAVRRNMETGEPYELDLELTGDGPTRWIAARSETKRATNGRIIGLRGTAQDITERKLVERSFLESEERFTAAFHASPDLMAVTRLSDGRILEVNEAYTRLLGYSRKESIGKTTAELDIWVDPVDRATFIGSLAESGRINDFETRLRRKDGTVLLCIDSARTIEFGGETCVLSVVRDITERKRTENALRASEERYRTLFEQSPAGVYRSTLDGRMLLANDALARLLGYPSVEEILQTAAQDLYVSLEDREYFLAQLHEHGAVRNLERELRRRDGSRVWVVDSANLVRDDRGGLTEIQGALIDLTERRRLELEMRRLVAAVEQVAESVVITDTEGTIQYVNPAFSESTGYSREEALGVNSRILKSGRQPAEFYRDLWRTISRGAVWHGHFTNRRKDGSEYEEEATISPVRDERGEIAHYVAVKRDVTQERALEA